MKFECYCCEEIKQLEVDWVNGVCGRCAEEEE